MQGCRQQLRSDTASRIVGIWDLGFENIVVCALALVIFYFLVLSLIKICHLHNISFLFINHAFTKFVTYREIGQ